VSLAAGLARRVLLAGILAGLIAGSFITAIQAVKLAPLIEAGEHYETAAQSAHDSGHAAWEPAEGVERTAFTWLANVVVAAGFGLLLSAGFALRHGLAGAPIDARIGLLWGIGGFAAFALAPALGLPPEPPGTAAAALGARQAWWIATALATAGGLSLFAFVSGAAWKALGALLLVLPHAVGAPVLPDPGGSALPAQIAAEFAAASLAIAALFWVVLGSVGGWLFDRLVARGG
jgi:cobalt transporter subunit CbtA